MSVIIEDFDSIKITNASIQFFNGDTQAQGTKFGLIATIDGETEMKEFIKKAEGVEIKRVTKPIKHNLTVSGHIPVKVIRDVFGLSGEGLKPGVYSYGKNSKGKKFVFTADVVDEFEDVTKLIAFPNCSSNTGLKITVENDADEVAPVELEFTALADNLGNFYYEAFSEEVEETIKTQWHKTFSSDLVKSTTP